MSNSKLLKLVEMEGYEELDEFLEEFSLAAVVPGICTNPDCDYTEYVEPDCTEGWCEECETQTVKSGLILAGVI